LTDNSHNPLLLIVLFILENYYCCCCYYYQLYAGYLQLYTQNKPCHYGIQCCSCSVFTVCATCAVILHVKYVLYFYSSTSSSICAVTNMAVFCSYLISCFLDMLLKFCLSDFEVVPLTPVIDSITFAFTFHLRWISIISSLYFQIFAAFPLITFLSPEIVTSINVHVPSFVSRVLMSGLLLGIVL